MLVRFAAVALTALLLGGCGAFTAPAQPTAGDLTDIVAALVLRHMTITDQVAGDPGCGSQISALHSNAVRYDVRPAGDSNSYPVYVFSWKSQATFDADKVAFDSCVGAEEQSSIGPVDIVEYLPWRAFGPGWPTGLRDAVDAALKGASGIPAPQEPE
ncbi:MAG TPA: hypothetical protein VIK08_02315 [Candidatus Limnocylindrales bacterium]